MKSGGKSSGSIGGRGYHATFTLALLGALAVFSNREELARDQIPAALVWAALLLLLPALKWPALARRDQPVAATLAFAAAFALAPDSKSYLRSLVQVGLLWLPLLALLQAGALARRWRELLLVAASVAAALVAVSLLGPTVMSRWVLRGYNLDIDHRPKPFFNAEINEDGLRSPYTSADFKADEYNIIFLGDSFTFASAVPREQGWVPLVEKRLASRYPDKQVRAANFGWISSSPILQLRQLRQLGAKYKPKLVVQCFDQTDFHDDLSYAEEFHDAGVDRPTGRITIFRALSSSLSALLGVSGVGRWLRSQLAFGAPASPYKLDKPNQRFFFLHQPLEESAPHMELSWSIIRETAAYARSLGADYALFIFPRYQQYNRDEAPLDKSRSQFPDSDRYLMEPFRYFEEKAKTVAFPIHSLLSAFREAKVFPTCPPDDPHWNAAGNEIAADAIARFLAGDGFLEKR